MLKKHLRGIALGLAAMAALAVAGCGTMMGPFNGLGSDYMTLLVVYRTDNKPLTYEQYQAVQEVAAEDHLILKGQLSSPFEAMGAAGAAGAAAGAAGGASQGIFYEGAMAGAAAGYTATVYGLGYVVNGAMSYSYGRAFDEAQMVETTIRDREKYDKQKVFARVHVVAAFVRSLNNINDPASSLKKQMPDFTGDKVSHSRD